MERCCSTAALWPSGLHPFTAGGGSLFLVVLLLKRGFALLLGGGGGVWWGRGKNDFRPLPW